MRRVDEVLGLIETLRETERQEVLKELRSKYPIHPLESRLRASAETILEAIARSSALTIRGIEGIIAESAFFVDVMPHLRDFTNREFTGDQAYDYLLEDSKGVVRVQVKMQRRKEGRPLRANEVKKARGWSAEYFVAETQRTRSGRSASGAGTRPYRFESFDILAVSLGASTGSWSDFLYVPERWLIPDDRDTSCLLVYQPVPPSRTDYWTDDFVECVERFRSGEARRIPG